MSGQKSTLLGPRIVALPSTTRSSPALLSYALMQPKFLYFDLGKVLVDFSVEQMYRQIGAAAGVSADEARVAVFGGGLMRQHEYGRLSERQFYEAFCAATGARPDYHALAAQK